MKKILFASILFLSANAYTFKAEIGCNYLGKTLAWANCIKSIKLNGRLESYYELTQRNDLHSNAIIKKLPLHFNLTVIPQNNMKYYVKITDKNGNEVFYDEKANKYSAIRVRN